MTSYIEDADEFDAPAYSVQGWKGVAFHVLGWETDGSDEANPTGDVVVCMVGDDRLRVVSKADLAALASDQYCGSCGQVGCTHT